MFRFDDPVWRERSSSFEDSKGSEFKGSTRDGCGGSHGHDDDFVLAQVEKNTQDDLLKALDTILRKM